jgi:sugar phosphate isomerase/epimerase
MSTTAVKRNEAVRASKRFSRRQFLARAAATSTTVALTSGLELSAATPPTPPIVVFSKVYQELKLNFDDAASMTAEAELDGVDCPVRPGGEILPERATEELPKYHEKLRQNNLQMPLLTTAITSVATPYAESLLRTAKKLGIQYYRLGFIERQTDNKKQVTEVRSQLKELAAFNKELGLTGLLQNHSPAGHTTYLGADLTELSEVVADSDPARIGIAFDIAHALVVHGNDWRLHFERLKSHFRIAYIKDVALPREWVPFGQGAVGGSGYFKVLKTLGYQRPISLHIEFDWGKQAGKTRAALVQTLRDSRRVLKTWLAG